MFDNFDVEALIGLDEEDAIIICTHYGYTVRIMEVDGEKFFGTADFKTNRINISLEKGYITNAHIG